MIIEEFNNIKAEKGVIKISEVDSAFENLYLKVITKEKRNYSDDEVRLLPYASKINPHQEEWALRTKSFLRFKKYLSRKISKLNILDLGCGNGWFTGKLVSEFDHNYFCVDINLQELEQAARVFNHENIKFIYTDVFSTSLPSSFFDLIVINSALQFFPNISSLMKELFFISKPYGEIHIIDTPFYDPQILMQAKNNTLKHYQSLGFPEMAKYYYHHTTNDLKYLRHDFLYNPDTLKNKLFSLFFDKDSTYPWIVITR